MCVCVCVCVQTGNRGVSTQTVSKQKARSHPLWTERLSFSLEFIWANLPSSTNLFTNVLFYRYEGPDGFCFDTNCADPPLVTNPQSPEYNVLERVRVLMEYLDEQVI